jgi:hypothetical protein
MITIKKQAAERFDDETETFVELPAVAFSFNYTLHAMALYEEFKGKSIAEGFQNDAVTVMACMVMSVETTEDVKTLLVDEIFLSAMYNKDVIDEVFRDVMAHRSASRKKVSVETDDKEGGASETYYAMMSELGIPWIADRWHISRLQALINAQVDLRNPKGNKAAKRRPVSSDDISEARARNQRKLEELANGKV